LAKEYVPGETKEQRKIRKAKEKGITLKDKVKIASPVIVSSKTCANTCTNRSNN
jgi:hypothetical protein